MFLSLSRHPALNRNSSATRSKDAQANDLASPDTRPKNTPAQHSVFAAAALYVINMIADAFLVEKV